MEYGHAKCYGVSCEIKNRPVRGGAFRLVVAVTKLVAALLSNKSKGYTEEKEAGNNCKNLDSEHHNYLRWLEGCDVVSLKKKRLSRFFNAEEKC